MDYARNIETYKKVFRPTELYNLKEDISEEENVIKDYPDIVKDLKERLESYIKKGRSTEGINQKKTSRYADRRLGASCLYGWLRRLYR